MEAWFENFEELRNKEKEFLELFKCSNTYTLAQFGKILNGNLSEIFTLKKYKEIIRKLKNENIYLFAIKQNLKIVEKLKL